MTLRASVSQGTAVTELGILLMACRSLNATPLIVPVRDVIEPIGAPRPGKLPWARDVAFGYVPVKALAKVKRTS